MSNFFNRLLNDSSSSDEEEKKPGSRQRSSLRDNTHKVRAMEIESVGNTDIVIELAAILDC